MPSGLVSSQVKRNCMVESVRGEYARGVLFPLQVRSATTQAQPRTIEVPNAAFGGRVSSVRRIREEYTGNMVANIHPDWINPFLEAWLGGYFLGDKPTSVTLGAALQAASANPTTVTFNKEVKVGSVFTVTGADTTQYTITGEATGNNVYNFSPARPTGAAQVASGAAVTIVRAAGTVLTDGIEFRTFLFEDELLSDADDPTSEEYSYLRGVQLTGGTLNFPADGLIELNSSYIARSRREEATRPAALGVDADDPVRSLTADELLVTSTGIDTVEVSITGRSGSTNLGNSKRDIEAQSFSIGMQPASAARSQTVVGQNEAKGIAVGALRGSYTGTMYYDSLYRTLAAASKANEQAMAVVLIRAKTGKGIRFTLPWSQITTVDYQIPEDSAGDVAVPFTFTPLANSDAGSTGLSDSYFGDRRTAASYVKVEIDV